MRALKIDDENLRKIITDPRQEIKQTSLHRISLHSRNGNL